MTISVDRTNEYEKGTENEQETYQLLSHVTHLTPLSPPLLRGEGEMKPLSRADSPRLWERGWGLREVTY